MAKQARTSSEHQTRVTSVLAFVRQYYEEQLDSSRPDDEPLTLPALADLACHSPFHFERVFQAQTGVTVMQHVRTFRLVRAAVDLRLTDAKIVDIALGAGYANHESFSRAFRTHFDESPRNYRKRNRANAQQFGAMNREGACMIKVGLVKIPVTDFNAATHYYREVIGLEEEFAVEAYGWAQYNTGNVPLCLYVTGQGGGAGVPGSEVGFHLAVDNIETFYADIHARGGEFASEIVGSDDGGKFFMIRDPDGNTFKVLQSVG